MQVAIVGFTSLPELVAATRSPALRSLAAANVHGQSTASPDCRFLNPPMELCRESLEPGSLRLLSSKGEVALLSQPR